METTEEINKIKQKFENVFSEYLNNTKLCKYVNYCEDLKSWSKSKIIKFEFETTTKLNNFGKVESDFINEFLELYAYQLYSAIGLKNPNIITNREELIKLKTENNSTITHDKLLIDSELFNKLELKEINYIYDRPLIFNLWDIDLIKIYSHNKPIEYPILYDSGMITLNFYGKDNIELEVIEDGDLITINMYFLIDISETYCSPNADINSIKKIKIETK
ncbi:MAG: hypothetical protein PHD33_05165 [Atribacterota bacterium]|nr:hypothetical protein [Atribacterota bacterium]